MLPRLSRSWPLFPEALGRRFVPAKVRFSLSAMGPTVLLPIGRPVWATFAVGRIDLALAVRGIFALGTSLSLCWCEEGSTC